MLAVTNEKYYFGTSLLAEPKKQIPEWSKRIRKRYDELRKSNGKDFIDQLKIAHALGVSKGAVSHWMCGRREPSNSEWAPLAKVLDTTPEYLRYGISIFKNDQKDIDENVSIALSSQDDFNRRLEVFKLYRVPVLQEWNQARQGINAVTMYAQNCQNVVYFTKPVSKHTYGLPLSVTTMISTDKRVRGFFPGEKIIVDPGMLPSHEKCVIADAPHLPSPILRQYNDENGIITLKSFDVREQTIYLNKEWKILGVVIGSVWED
jgi:transcriptional regulator with XRE-family HTH domain